MKYQILLLVAASCALLLEAQAKPSVSGSCTPETTFQVKCNICKCNTDGTGMLCTKRICEDEYEVAASPTESQKEADNAEKKESDKVEDKKQDGENAETTKEETKADAVKGQAEKEEAKVAENGEEKATTSEVEPKTNLADSETCNPGQTYSMDCNTCTCPPSGLKASSVCTLLACH